jgi:hypothetical protein
VKASCNDRYALSRRFVGSIAAICAVAIFEIPFAVGEVLPVTGPLTRHRYEIYH